MVLCCSINKIAQLPCAVVVVVVFIISSLTRAVSKYDSGDEDTNGSLPWHYFRIFQYPGIMDSISGASGPVPGSQ